MTKTFAVGSIGYGFGVIAFGMARAVDLWDSVSLSTMTQLAANEGLAWPLHLVRWIL